MENFAVNHRILFASLLASIFVLIFSLSLCLISPFSVVTVLLVIGTGVPVFCIYFYLGLIISNSLRWHNENG